MLPVSSALPPPLVDALISAGVGADPCLTFIVIGTPTPTDTPPVEPGCEDEEEDPTPSGAEVRFGSTIVDGVNSYVREGFDDLTERVTVVAVVKVEERRKVEA